MKNKFQSICNEIKRALGGQASYREILECAQFVMSVYTKDINELESLGKTPRTLDQKPLYEIWEEDPWTIYFKESLLCPFEETDHDQSIHQYAN